MLIDYFGSDTNTRTILIHMESIVDMRSFLSAAREVALQKPIIIIKAGRTGAAARAFAWHSTCTVSDDDVLDAALRRVGVLRVNSVEDLFHTADALSKERRPEGPRLAVVRQCRRSRRSRCRPGRQRSGRDCPALEPARQPEQWLCRTALGPRRRWTF